MDVMTWVTWIVVGALVGWFTSIIFGSSRQYGALLDTVVGLIGSIAAGLLFYFSNVASAVGFNLWNLLVGVVGAVVLVGLYRLFFVSRNTATPER